MFEERLFPRKREDLRHVDLVEDVDKGHAHLEEGGVGQVHQELDAAAATMSQQILKYKNRFKLLQLDLNDSGLSKSHLKPLKIDTVYTIGWAETCFFGKDGRNLSNRLSSKMVFLLKIK